MSTHTASVRRRPIRAVALFLVVLLVAAACGGDDPAAEDQATTDTAPVASTAAPSGGAVSSAEVPDPPVADPDAASRCERFDYPCSWAEAGDAVLEDSLAVADAALALLDDATLDAGFDSVAELLLADDRVVEAAFDTEGYTAVMLRLEGGLPVYLFTPLAAPLRDPAEGGSALGAPAGVIQAELASFEVTREPALEPRKALVLDPYASVEPAAESFEVANLFNSHPDFKVDHITDAVGPAELTGWGGYDAVHVSTHGSSWCPGKVLFKTPDLPGIGVREYTEYDLDQCHSGFGAGPLSAISGSWRNTPGLSVVTSKAGGTPHNRLYVSDEFFATQASMSETVVFLSSCQGGGNRIRGGRIPMVGMFGSFLGWDNNVSASGTANTAREFWRLMAVEGLEFELAVERLEAQNLNTDAYDRNTVENFIRDLIPKTGQSGGFDTSSMLVSSGKNLRIRDVITTFVDGAELAPESRIRTELKIEDGVNDYIPEIKFRVEGVRDGEEATALVKVILDSGKELDREIRVSEGNTIQDAEGWKDWEITVENLELPFDLTVEDVRHENPKEHTWEARVYDGAGNYSARKENPVYFAGGIEAAGPLPIFEQLESVVAAAGATVEGNELLLRFSSDGGPVEGGLHVTLSQPPAGEVGYWDVVLTGTFDAATGTMEGEATGEARVTIQIAGISAGDDGKGPWEAVVDLDARTVIGVIGMGDSNQPFEARFR